MKNNKRRSSQENFIIEEGYQNTDVKALKIICPKDEQEFFAF